MSGARETVNHPAHYQTAAGIEAIDVIEAYGLGASWHLGDAAKYLLRAGRNGSAGEDLRKARGYVQRWDKHIAFKVPGAWPDLALAAGDRPTPDEVVAAFGLTGDREMAMRALLALPLAAGRSWATRRQLLDELTVRLVTAVLEADASDNAPHEDGFIASRFNTVT
jgi:hypothetical protein